MSENNDYRSDMDVWADMWDEMQADGSHPEAEKPQPSAWAAEVLGDEPQDAYYDYLGAEELLSEESTPNPVYPDSAGADQTKPDPVWVNEKLLDDVTKLKDRLFRVENQIARMGQGKKLSEKAVVGDSDSKLMGEIDSIRKQIEKMSSQLGIQDEPSPWQVKKD